MDFALDRVADYRGSGSYPQGVALSQHDVPDVPVWTAARALLECSDLGARDIVERALTIAADICVFTNHNLTLEELDSEA